MFWQRSVRRERVPVEHRLFGIDKRTMPLGLVVLGVFVLATVVVPRVDRAVAWGDEVQAGEQLRVAAEVVFTPTAGWNVESGFRADGGGSAVDSGPAIVVSDGVVFFVEASSFNGGASDLLEQVEKVTSSVDDPSFRVEGDPASVTTDDGVVGVVQSYSSVRGDGVVAAFVIDGTGVKVTAYGPPQQMTAAADDVHAMVTSIRRTNQEDDA